jgi:superfamily II RNA helicase
LVAYDLGDEDEDYGLFFQALHSLDAFARPLDSVWVVQTTRPLAELKAALSRRLHFGDRLLVVECAGDADWSSVRPETTLWLEDVFTHRERAKEMDYEPRQHHLPSLRLSLERLRQRAP